MSTVTDVQRGLFQLHPEHREFLRRAFDGKRVVILGGSGQIGRFLQDVIWQSANVEAMSSRRMDLISDAGSVREYVQRHQPHYVFNLSAKVTGITYNEKHHFDMCLQNLLLQALPLWACQGLLTRLVQISTACVLPCDAIVPTPELPTRDIFGSPEPSNYGYGLAKQIGELLLELSRQEEPNRSSVVVRPWNLYGRELPDAQDGHVIPSLTWKLLSKQNPVQMRGVPTTRRPFTHAWDAAVGIALIAATGFEGTLNLGSPIGVSIGALTDALCTVVGFHPKFLWGSESEQGYPARAPDLQNLDQVFASHGIPYWEPTIDLHEGLAEYVQWCLRQSK